MNYKQKNLIEKTEHLHKMEMNKRSNENNIEKFRLIFNLIIEIIFFISVFFSWFILSKYFNSSRIIIDIYITVFLIIVVFIVLLMIYILSKKNKNIGDYFSFKAALISFIILTAISLISKDYYITFVYLIMIVIIIVLYKKYKRNY